MTAWNKQEGGNHYLNFEIQPSEYIQKNGFSWLQGNAIKYISRYNLKGSAELDLKKAKHYIELLEEELAGIAQGIINQT